MVAPKMEDECSLSQNLVRMELSALGKKSLGAGHRATVRSAMLAAMNASTPQASPGGAGLVCRVLTRRGVETMRFELKFDMDNDVFVPDWRAEALAVLHDVTEAIEGGCVSSSVHDSNGNTVGRFFATTDNS